MTQDGHTFYLVFAVDRLPDLTLTKYSVFDASSVEDIMDKHAVFLRQLHRLGSTSGVYFHLLYYFNPDERIAKGHHLSIFFYATSHDRRKLDGIREFLITSVLSTYYDFHCYEVSTSFKPEILLTSDGRKESVVRLMNISGQEKIYGVSKQDADKIEKCRYEIEAGLQTALSCEIASDANAVLSVNSQKLNKMGQVLFSKKYVLAKRIQIHNSSNTKEDRLWLYESNSEDAYSEPYEFDGFSEQAIELLKKGQSASDGNMFICYFLSDSRTIFAIEQIPCDEDGPKVFTPNMVRTFQHLAFLTKKDYYLPAQNRLSTDSAGEVPLYSIMDWEPAKDGRLYNVLKLMEGYNRTAALRIDLFPVAHTQSIRQKFPYADTRRRISDRMQGKDDNSENIIKSWDKYLQNLMKFPPFLANVVAFADSNDIAVMLADSVAAEAVESGTYLIESQSSNTGWNLYHSDSELLKQPRNDPTNHVAEFLSLYTLEEIRPMFSFPILYPGESIECLKETDPKPFQNRGGECISLGTSSLGYDVTFPVELFKKHAFIAGVPGAGKTNTMLHLITSLWRDTQEHIPFLVLEPAKQEYRSLAKIQGMEELHVFSPGADTYFPLHINPFQFPVGLTLAEHIANLNAVFAGAFELPPPSPHFIDSCIEKVYLDQGWNVNERNELDEKGQYRHRFPTLQELYASLEVAVKNSHYQGETLGNLQSVLEVRVGSLLKREIGNVYNVRESILKPEQWLDVPAIIELEALGEGPANFMSLLLSTLIRETLKVRKINQDSSNKKTLNHVIFYEEAHNLIGPDTESPLGNSVDPKISATKYLVKMLAEVRALDEGIVIADQLPTVMAAEVLKNTGLKIAHRITAQDDRSLLGSTMSASPDQLEEQATFSTGWALIFYEDLLKPYQMRVHEWDASNVNPAKYDSPSNYALFEILRDNQVYLSLLSKSKEIMVDKMTMEFALLREEAIKLKKSVHEDKLKLERMEQGLRNLKSTVYSLPSNAETDRAHIDLQKDQQEYDNRCRSFNSKYQRELTRLCQEFSNRYYASITLSKNYDRFSNDLYACTIRGFLSLFEVMRSLAGIPELAECFVQNTERAMTDIEHYISLSDGNGIIPSDYPYYNQMIYAEGYFWINQIYISKKALEGQAKRLLQMSGDKTSVITEYCERWTSQFLSFYKKADAYAASACALSRSKEEESRKCYMNAPENSDQLHKQALEIKSRQHSIHKAIHSLVVAPFQVLQHLDDLNKVHLLKATKLLRNRYMEITNFWNENAVTILSSDPLYKSLRESASCIAVMDLLIRFKSAYKSLSSAVAKLSESGESSPDLEALWNVCQVYVAYFKYYSGFTVESYAYKICLVNHYLQFLDIMMDTGPAGQKLLFEDVVRSATNGCASVYKKLSDMQVVPAERQREWIRIQNKAAKVFITQ